MNVERRVETERTEWVRDASQGRDRDGDVAAGTETDTEMLDADADADAMPLPMKTQIQIRAPRLKRPAVGLVLGAALLAGWLALFLETRVSLSPLPRLRVCGLDDDSMRLSKTYPNNNKGINNVCVRWRWLFLPDRPTVRSFGFELRLLK